MNIKKEGIVIRVTQYKEKDAMVEILTDSGLVSFGAHGILDLKSKNSYACLLFAKSEFILVSKQDRLTLSSSKLINSYYHLYDSIEVMSCLGLMVDCILHFVSNDEIELYQPFNKVLELMNNGFDIYTLTAIFLAKIIQVSGYELSVNECAECGVNKKIVGVDYDRGGLICANCDNHENSLHKGVNYIQTYRYCFLVGADNFQHYVIPRKICLEIIRDFYHYLCKNFDIKALKSYGLFENVINVSK